MTTPTETSDETVPTPDDWRQTPARDYLKFDRADRQATVICKPVDTASGSVYTCRLFVSDNPYGMGKPVTSAIAESREIIGETITELETHI